MHRSSFAILLATSFVLAACGDGPAGLAGETTSSLRFTYAGPVAGSFVAEGEADTTRSPLVQTFALGQRYAEPRTLAVHAVRGGGSSASWTSIAVPAHLTGSYVIDDATCASWDDACAAVTVALEVPLANGSQAAHSCTLRTGTIRVTGATATRLAGEFSGTGDCLTRDGEFVEGFVVTGGRFDVAVVEARRETAE